MSKSNKKHRKSPVKLQGKEVVRSERRKVKQLIEDGEYEDLPDYHQDNIFKGELKD